MTKAALIKLISENIPSFILKPKNRILFESVPDISDNTKPVFDEMIKRGLNNKYEMVWIVSKANDSFPQLRNVKYVLTKNTFRLLYYQNTSKLIICCNTITEAYRKNQQAIYLTHGLPVKAIKKYYTVPEGIDYTIAPSIQSIDIISDQYAVDIKKIKPLGYPRNDVLLNPQININELFNFEGNVIIWLPTFRQHLAGRKHGGNPLPILHDEEKAFKLNEVAKETNSLIVLKPHFAQDMTYIKKQNLSNIMIINDLFLQERNITLYQLMSASSALLSDYSSVYFDYTLCNKPIGVIWEDIEEYRQEPGFAFDINYYLKGAEKIYTYDDFVAFINNVANGVDRLNKERNEIKEEVTFTDGLSTKRVVDFIETLLKSL